MKIICETAAFNRQAPNVKPRYQQSTLAMGYHPPGTTDLDNLFMINFSSANKTGTRYKVKRNIEKVYTRFANEGKTTIAFKLPTHDLQIKCDPVQLKLFLNELRNALEGKPHETRLTSLAVTGVPKKAMPVLKLNISKPSDYPVRGLPRTLQQLQVSEFIVDFNKTIDFNLLLLFIYR